MSTEENTDYSQPVAYTQDGQPLYVHPPKAPAPQVVHMARPHQPIAPVVSPETRQKHEQAKKRYPSLNLSEGEYIISAVQRHPIGLVPIIGIVGFFMIVIWVLTANYKNYLASPAAASMQLPSFEVLTVISLLLSLLAVIGGAAAVYIYVHNRFFLTNESVIQEIQLTLFSRHEQTVSLANIEDASFYQQSIIQTIFNYGLIRLSTEGDETTYRFTYVANPKKEIAILNNAVEAFKNGRPVSED